MAMTAYKQLETTLSNCWQQKNKAIVVNVLSKCKKH